MWPLKCLCRRFSVTSHFYFIACRNKRKTRVRVKCSAPLSCSESAQSRGRPWGRWSVFSESCRCCCPDFSCPDEDAETCERRWAPLHIRRVRVRVHVCANKGNAPLPPPPPPPLLGVPRRTRFYLIWIIFNSKCEKNKNTFCFISLWFLRPFVIFSFECWSFTKEKKAWKKITEMSERIRSARETRRMETARARV